MSKDKIFGKINDPIFIFKLIQTIKMSMLRICQNLSPLVPHLFVRVSVCSCIDSFISILEPSIYKNREKLSNINFNHKSSIMGQGELIQVLLFK